MGAKQIVIDARLSGTSSGRYIDKLVQHLHDLQSEHQFTVLTKAHRLDFMRSIAPNFEIVESNFQEFTFAEQLGFKRQLKKLNPDLMHFAMTQQPVGYHQKKVTTIHDLTTLRFDNPATNKLVFRTKQRVYAWVIRRVARDSAQVITPSQYVKDDLLAFAKINPGKVTVTYEAADKITAPAQPFHALEDKQFLLYVGRPTPHKNLGRLVEAFQQLQAQHPKLHLVLTGKVDANSQSIERDIANQGIKNVVFSDFVSDPKLRWLYEHCAAYVFPSLSEGFGLPGMEAMAQGAPVVSSNATCLPEIYGDAAHYFDPTNVQAMTDAINEVLTDKDLRQQLIQAGRQQAAKYSWKKMAEQTLAVYEQVLKV